MVTNRTQKIITVAMMLVLWFLVADAYWMGKERKVERCTLEASTELIKHTSGEWYFRKERWYSQHNGDGMEYFNAAIMVGRHCSWAEGGGNYWNEASGLAYWEILVTLPVIYRYRFD